jgi:hypothetical protein
MDAGKHFIEYHILGVSGLALKAGGLRGFIFKTQ